MADLQLNQANNLLLIEALARKTQQRDVTQSKAAESWRSPFLIYFNNITPR